MTSPFHQYSVAETKAPLVTESGLTVVPNYTFETGPQPKVIVIPAEEASEAMLQWIRKSSEATDVTMSVCVGAFVLARTWLLDGKSATTHHSSYKQCQRVPQNPCHPRPSVCRGRHPCYIWWPGLRHRSCHARGRKIFWEESGGRHRLQPGVSGPRVEGSKLERDLCPGADLPGLWDAV